MLKIFIVVVSLGISVSTYSQTLISDQTEDEIIFSSLDSQSDSTFDGQVSDETNDVRYGPWGCNFTLQPINFECGREEIVVPPPDVSKEQQIILDFLESKREELTVRENVIGEKEIEISNLERRLEQKIDELLQLNNQIEEARIREAQFETENLRKLVSYYEKIPAENAAIFIDTMDEQTATMILTRMNSRRVAAILTELTAEKAAELTESIAKITTNRETFSNLPDFGNN